MTTNNLIFGFILVSALILEIVFIIYLIFDMIIIPKIKEKFFYKRKKIKELNTLLEKNKIEYYKIASQIFKKYAIYDDDDFSKEYKNKLSMLQETINYYENQIKDLTKEK